MGIPFVDLKAQYKSIKPEIDTAISNIIESCAFIGGKAVEQFEHNFAEYCGAKYAVGASSGTSALHLALVVMGIGPGDEVIAPCNTFIATTEAITQAGAKAVLVDVQDDTLLIDPEKIEAAVTPNTKAIIPVHLYGQPADMDALRAIADRHSLKIIADAAQAHGSSIGEDRTKILGDVTAYSFYPGKNLGAYGDAGMIVMNDGAVRGRADALANHGRKDKYLHFAEGWNYRLDGIQAAILDVKLRYLDGWIEGRRRSAARYKAGFAGYEGVKPVTEVAGSRHVYHLYVVRCADRDTLGQKLRDRGIATGVHYPVPLHLQPAYEYLGLSKGSFPVAERAAEEIISLPMYPELTDEMVDEVVGSVKEIVSGK